MSSEKLHNIVAKIRKPLDFASRDDYASLRSLAGMEPFMAIQVQELRTFGAEAATCDELLMVFQGFDGLPDSAKKERIQRAAQALDRMEGRGTDPGMPQGDRPSAVRAGDALRLNLSAPVQSCDKRIGPRRAELLTKLGIVTLDDAIANLPWRYEDRGNIKKLSQLTYGALETVTGEVIAAEVIQTKRQRVKVFELVITDRTGVLVGSWFNQPFMQKTFRVGQRVVLYGVVKANPYRGGRAQMDNPEFEVLDEEEGDSLLVHTGRIVPIYHTTAGISPRLLRSIMKNIIDSCAAAIVEPLPAELVQKYGLLPAREAVAEVHFPEREKDIVLLNRGRSKAHRRMIFEELFVLELGLARRKRAIAGEKKGIAFRPMATLETALRSSLPYRLTAAQERVITEIKRDMGTDHPMNRLVQGDVGCGKTVVALLACLLAVENGFQACVMAPTEILAEQHARNMAALTAALDVTVLSLTGSLRKKEREQALAGIASGRAQIVVGTHALIEQDVRFHRLGLAIIDEQHRFGVLQRSTLKAKGYEPDVLVMTATPIPRTLAMTVYGDLDVSVIDEMPPGRSPVNTRLFYESKRQEAYRLMEEELRTGRQVYVVYPLVEETEKSDLKAATEMAVHLQQDVFPDWRVGLLHGRMKGAEKEQVMAAFKAGEVHLLVSTTVIEVGVDVPNATVMVIEHPERFGLAQLHQLRGRVGRGEHQSWCVLMGPRMFVDETRERLLSFVRTNDGFQIAEEDLRLRGPGEFFGTRQSGLPDLRAANILRDADLLETCRQEAFSLTERDPELTAYPDLRALVERRWRGRLGPASVS